ncbi:DTW domain protein [Bacteriovorax sp. BSW11_IV]|uniref:tRNA-uridine aminocarboxypropyltransferase n=1 Tax=Bacteriovorax sp. BSW11_IV TaxID=1353529 RepID=UPI00038A2F2E|nr:tRNA-uridine aminocarboxypropyltransferase [Bacteriovorax sp. BSW11_IV]EQC50123.1 DTW domain protein [Bacteriovorax sp. BSW11_IV]
MNKEEYLKRKKAQQKEFEELPRRSKCFSCYRPLNACLCNHISSFDTKAKFVLLMHIKEARREKLGTGRITAATLTNSEVIVGVDFTEDTRVNELLCDPRYYPVVLYPGDEAYNVSVDPIEKFPLPPEKELLIFVIDGTWPCAKKMMKESSNIRHLPRIMFSPNKKSNFLIKHQPDELCLSTLESIHFLLQEMDKVGLENLEGKEDRLLGSFGAHVEFQLKCSSDPTIPSNRGRKRINRPEEMKIIPKRHRKFVID